MTLCGYSQPPWTNEPGLGLFQIGDGGILEGETKVMLAVLDDRGRARVFASLHRPLSVVADPRSHPAATTGK